MALINQPTLDFSDRDFQSLRLRLQGLARSVFPEWTDFNTANYGNILLELMAFVGDNLAFYQDAQARELFWPTLTRRISAIRQGRLINFTLPGASAASGTARVTIPTARTSRVPIPVGTVIRSIDPINPMLFQTVGTDTAFLPIGQTFVDVTCEQSESVTNETFESTNGPNQEFQLSRTPYLEQSLSVIASDGVYTEIDSFINVTTTDTKKFVVLVDQNNRARLRFGNGTLGKIPLGTITCDYKISNGVAGNIEAGQLGVLVNPLVDEASVPVTGVTVTNPTSFGGGSDPMSVAQARALAPASLKSLTRSVTKPDFEAHALEVPGVARALMLTSNEDVTVAENSGVLLIVSRGQKLDSGRYAAATPSAAVIASLQQKFVDKPPTITFGLNIQAAPFKAINVSTRIYLKPGAVPATIKINVVDALKDLFAVALEDGTANSDIDFGANFKNAQGQSIGEIAWSDVLNAVRDVAGIRKIDEGPTGLILNGLRASVTIGLREFPVLGTIQIVDADTGLTL